MDDSLSLLFLVAASGLFMAYQGAFGPDIETKVKAWFSPSPQTSPNTSPSASCNVTAGLNYQASDSVIWHAVAFARTNIKLFAFADQAAWSRWGNGQIQKIDDSCLNQISKSDKKITVASGLGVIG